MFGVPVRSPGGNFQQVFGHRDLVSGECAGVAGGCLRCRAGEAKDCREKPCRKQRSSLGWPRASTRIRWVLRPFFLEAKPTPVCSVCYVVTQCCFNESSGPSPPSLPMDSLRVSGFQVQGEKKVG